MLSPLGVCKLKQDSSLFSELLRLRSLLLAAGAAHAAPSAKCDAPKISALLAEEELVVAPKISALLAEEDVENCGSKRLKRIPATKKRVPWPNQFQKTYVLLL